jgi:hypothetical protein
MGRTAESVVSARRGVAALLAAGLVLGTPARGAAHPLHTTLTEVTLDATSHTVRVMVRVFAEDFGTALTQHGHLAAAPVDRAWDGEAASYLGAAFAIADRTSRPIILHSCGTRRNGDLLWICLEGTTVESAHELRGRNSILCDVFDDQVNIVQFVSGAEKHSVLFTRGDGLKRLL